MDLGYLLLLVAGGVGREGGPGLTYTNEVTIRYWLPLRERMGKRPVSSV